MKLGAPRQHAQITRRALFGAPAAVTAAPVLAQECRLCPPQHHEGPLV